MPVHSVVLHNADCLVIDSTPNNAETKENRFRYFWQGTKRYIPANHASAAPDYVCISAILFPILSRQPPPLRIMGLL